MADALGHQRAIRIDGTDDLQRGLVATASRNFFPGEIML
jgi:hypothetical protein